MAYNLIGDVHGHGGAFEALLAKLGYRHAGGAWRQPPRRTAVFVGDLIDRGPRQVASGRRSTSRLGIDVSSAVDIVLEGLVDFAQRMRDARGDAFEIV